MVKAAALVETTTWAVGFSDGYYWDARDGISFRVLWGLMAEQNEVVRMHMRERNPTVWGRKVWCCP
jgi:hypothetical protein